MNQLVVHVTCLLAARQDTHRVWGRFDHQRPADGTNQLLILAGMGTILVVALWIWFRATRRPKSRFTANSGPKLFRELARAHGLGFASRRLLKRLAASRNLSSPALLFIEPQHFDPSTLPRTLQPAAKELQRVRARIFG